MNEQANDGLIRWSAFLKRMGVSEEAGYRWRQSGMIQPSVVIRGKLYLLESEAKEFWRRAKAGEFAKTAEKPK